jgi:hypothetical protein
MKCIFSRKETYRPPEFLTKPTNQVVHEGNRLKTVSKVNGIPPPQICWFKEGKPIRESDDSRFKIYTGEDGLSYFEIDNTSILDAGEYTCTASNVMGAVFSPINVVIEAMTEPEGSDMHSDVEKSNNDNAESDYFKSDTTDPAPNTVCFLVVLKGCSVCF